MTGVPTGASACSLAALAPVAIRTAPSAGTASPPPTVAAVTFAVRSTFGAVAGNGCRTIEAAFAIRGVRAP